MHSVKHHEDLATPFDETYMDYCRCSHLQGLVESYGPLDRGLFGRLEKASAGGDHQAMRELHYLCRRGELGLPRDPRLAVSWLGRVCDEGAATPEDLYLYGRALELGDHVETDVARAFRLYKKAATEGHKPSGVLAANYYRCGLNGIVEKNQEEAERLYRQVVGVEPLPYSPFVFEPLLSVPTQGKNLGWQYNPVEGFSYYAIYLIYNEKQQLSKALWFLEQAAHAGLQEPQTVLGLHFTQGTGGCPRLVDNGRYWLSEAAKGGSGIARAALLVLEADPKQPEPLDTDSEMKPMVKYLRENEGKSPAQIAIEGINPMELLPPGSEARKVQQYLAQLAEQSVNKQLSQNENPQISFHIERRLFHPLMVEFFAKQVGSPTAQRFQEAIEAFYTAFNILENQPSGEKYINPEGIVWWTKGMLLEAPLFMFICCPIDIYGLRRLVDKCVEEQPLNVCMKAAQLKLKYRMKESHSKLDEQIQEKERFVHHLEEKVHTTEIEEDILFDTIYELGSVYHITHQIYRALHSFEKCLKLRPNSIDALYAVGHNLSSYAIEEHNSYMQDEKDPLPGHEWFSNSEEMQRSVLILEEYLKVAPPCDKMYINAHMLLSSYYICQMKDYQKFLHYYERACLVRTKRLPFMNDLAIGLEDTLHNLYPVIRMRVCYYVDCINVSQNQLKRCTRCKTAGYCQRACQEKDWHNHKPVCSRIVGKTAKRKTKNT